MSVLKSYRTRYIKCTYHPYTNGEFDRDKLDLLHKYVKPLLSMRGTSLSISPTGIHYFWIRLTKNKSILNYMKDKLIDGAKLEIVTATQKKQFLINDFAGEQEARL